MVPEALSRDGILGAVLAGGASRRFGGNKALAELGGKGLLLRVVERARPQVAQLVLSGGNPAGIAAPVIPDMVASEGPLTGICSALRWARAAGFSAVATFTCDAPFFPMNLVSRLTDGMPPQQSCRLASSAGIRHPAFAVWRVSALERLEEIYRTGERSLKRAQDHVGAETIDFPAGEAPHGDLFFNINHADDLAVAQAWLKEAG